MLHHHGLGYLQRIFVNPLELLKLEKVMPTQLVAFLASLATHWAPSKQWQHPLCHSHATESKHQNKRLFNDNLVGTHSAFEQYQENT
jgi:hypothetical protein